MCSVTEVINESRTGNCKQVEIKTLKMEGQKILNFDSELQSVVLVRRGLILLNLLIVYCF